MAKFDYGRWQPVRSLDEGGQAFAYVVTDRQGEHQGEYVLRRIKSSAPADRYPGEVAALKKLTHPRIVPLIDHAPLDSPDRFIVMPFAAGGSLSKRAGLYGHTGLDALLNVAEQIAQALVQAHAANLVPRDVKPANILSLRTQSTC